MVAQGTTLSHLHLTTNLIKSYFDYSDSVRLGRHMYVRVWMLYMFLCYICMVFLFCSLWWLCVNVQFHYACLQWLTSSINQLAPRVTRQFIVPFLFVTLTCSWQIKFDDDDDDDAVVCRIAHSRLGIIAVNPTNHVVTCYWRVFCFMLLTPGTLGLCELWNAPSVCL